MEIKFLSDPGHGWLRVPLQLLNDWNISNKISDYSYKTTNFAYLEEDCDASIFIDEAKKRNYKYSIHYKLIKDFDYYLKSVGPYSRFNNKLQTA
jgi:hypothetical protein